ncbi:MAG: hypothetical protein ABIA97_03375 [Candidatus Omnitrophota bacterium]
MMEKKGLSEIPPNKVMKVRIISATAFSIFLIVFLTSEMTIPQRVALGIICWIVWFLFWHRLTIWLVRKFNRKT